MLCSTHGEDIQSDPLHWELHKLLRREHRTDQEGMGLLQRQAMGNP